MTLLANNGMAFEIIITERLDTVRTQRFFWLLWFARPHVAGKASGVVLSVTLRTAFRDIRRAHPSGSVGCIVSREVQ